METYLSTRPTSFPSRASGIEWHTRSRTIRNTNSARVSVPPLLIEDSSSSPTTSSPSQWRWRTDLSATKPFWENWFVGLSKKFLESRGGKLLLLAGTDRLDKELIIGQMQGASLSLSLFETTPLTEKCSRGFPSSTTSHPSSKLTRLTIPIHRQIPTRRLPRSRPLRTRRPARKDGPGRRRLLPPERPQRACPAAQGGRHAQGQNGTEWKGCLEVNSKKRLWAIVTDLSLFCSLYSFGPNHLFLILRNLSAMLLCPRF
jgi:hypothetical protein